MHLYEKQYFKNLLKYKNVKFNIKQRKNLSVQKLLTTFSPKSPQLLDGCRFLCLLTTVRTLSGVQIQANLPQC